MKKNELLIIPVFIVASSLVVGISAQTRKTTKKKTPAQTTAAPAQTTAEPTVDNSKTRARRTGTSATEAQPPVETASEQKPEPSPEKKSPEPTIVPLTANIGPAEPETKKEAKPETESVESSASLQDQINKAESGPARIRLQLKLVEELVAAGNKTDALKELHTISNTDVFDPTGFYNTGNSFARLNDTEGAIEAYKKAIDQKKGRYSRASNNLGVVLLRVGRWDEAYSAFNSALKAESFHYPEASYNLGRLYAARGQNDLAVREWRRVLTLNPDHTAAKDALAKVRNNDRVEVQPITVASTRENSVRTQDPQVSKPVNAAVSPKPVAVKSTTSPRSPRALVLDQQSYGFLQQARTSTEKGNTIDAIDNYKRLIKREGGYFAPANLELSFALISVKRFDEALENLQLVSSRDGSRYPISYFHLARLYEMKGELKPAEESFAKAAAEFGSQNSQFLLDLSRVREKQGDYAGALGAMEQYLKLMKQQGMEPSWSEERLTALRAKQTGDPKE